MEKSQKSIKVLLIGDSLVGKTCILKRFLENTYSENYETKYVDKFSYLKKVNNKLIELTFWDIAGIDDNRIESLAYPNTDIFLLCYSVDSESSFENLTKKYLKNVKFLCKNPKFILVGAKNDLKHSVSKNNAISFAESLKADFIECSSKDNNGINEIFDKIMIITLKEIENRRGFCSRFKRFFCCGV